MLKLPTCEGRSLQLSLIENIIFLFWQLSTLSSSYSSYLLKDIIKTSSMLPILTTLSTTVYQFKYKSSLSVKKLDSPFCLFTFLNNLTFPIWQKPLFWWFNNIICQPKDLEPVQGVLHINFTRNFSYWEQKSGSVFITIFYVKMGG